MIILWGEDAAETEIIKLVRPFIGQGIYAVDCRPTVDSFEEMQKDESELVQSRLDFMRLKNDA